MERLYVMILKVVKDTGSSWLGLLSWKYVEGSIKFQIT